MNSSGFFAPVFALFPSIPIVPMPCADELQPAIPPPTPRFLVN